MASIKEWLNERPGAKLDEEEAARREYIRKMRAESGDDSAPTELDQRTQVSPEATSRFDPRTEVSADAKYVVRNLVIWFLAVPMVLGLVIWGLTR